MSTIVHTLCFNLPSEVEDATRLLYELNPGNNFKHIIVDLGFPLEYGANIPDDIEKAKERNTVKLQRIAKNFGSEYIKCENIGVSQNWRQVCQYVNLQDDDVIISADPDERVHTPKWVDAIAEVISADKKIAACALLMREQKGWLADNPHTHTNKVVAGHGVYGMGGATIAMAQLGMAGHFLNKIGGVPVPDGWATYGHIETALTKQMRNHGYEWCILQDFYVSHTECSTLYRAWKTDITSGAYTGENQILFDQWLKLQQK